MQPNLLITFLASLVPMVLGFIWYNPKVFGNIWMKESGMTMEKAKSMNMAKIMGLTYLFSLMIAFILPTVVIHQASLYSTVMGDTTAETKSWLDAAIAKYGTNFRTFKHGMLHGFMFGLFIGLPIIGTSAVYENRSGKYIWIASGFWMISMMIMGGIICQWG